MDTDQDDALYVEPQHFAMVPEWVIEAPITDAAFRLYTVLLRCGTVQGARMPSRSTLARELVRSVKSIDRALASLVAAGVVRVEHRLRDGCHLSNRYWVRTSPPTQREPAGADRDHAPAERCTATRGTAVPSRRTSSKQASGDTRVSTPGDRSVARGGDTSAARPIVLQKETPPPSPSTAVRARRDQTTAARRSTSRNSSTGTAAHPVWLAACGLEDDAALRALAQRCAAARASAGLPAGRWTVKAVTAALDRAVVTRRWPASRAVDGLLLVSAMPDTFSPNRLAEAGPWWGSDGTGAPQPGAASASSAAGSPTTNADLTASEARLDALDGRRPQLQARARAELTAENVPLTRTTVVRRACEILDREAAAA